MIYGEWRCEFNSVSYVQVPSCPLGKIHIESSLTNVCHIFLCILNDESCLPKSDLQVLSQIQLRYTIPSELVNPNISLFIQLLWKLANSHSRSLRMLITVHNPVADISKHYIWLCQWVNGAQRSRWHKVSNQIIMAVWSRWCWQCETWHQSIRIALSHHRSLHLPWSHECRREERTTKWHGEAGHWHHLLLFLLIESGVMNRVEQIELCGFCQCLNQDAS